uniref:DNA replication complex GINS protein SLD5 n=1 Tax=Lygus hesperus TaxID=30085 RepID=A0A0A9YIF9_LYGHE
MSNLEEMFLGDEEGEDEDVITAKTVLDTITEAWVNEKLSPEILPHKAEFVEVMMEQIDQMEENVLQLQKTDLRSIIHRQELERIRFLIRSYLRTRLDKIELYSLWVFKNQSVLSPQELAYLKEYLSLSVAPLKNLCDRMPGPCGQINPRQMEIAPDLETHVFAKSKVDLPDTIIVNDGPREEEITIDKDSQRIVPYGCIREYVKNNQIKLI